MVTTIATILPIMVSALKQSSAVISEINNKCQTEGLPPAFEVNGVSIRGNTDYRFEGFGVNLIPLSLTFWTHYKPESPEHVNLGKFAVPITTLEILNVIPSGYLSNFKVPLDSIQLTSDEPHSYQPLSYLEDDSVTLKRGSLDQVGARNYNKPANVPATYVQRLQEDLTQLGFSLGECDGDFGGKTEAALKEFQARSNSQDRNQGGCATTVTPTYQGSVNGVCDAATREEIKLWLDRKYQKPSPEPSPWVGSEQPKPTETFLHTALINDPDPPLNVRADAGTTYPVVGKLDNKTSVEVVEDNQAGWVRINSPIKGWVAKRYTQHPGAKTRLLNLVRTDKSDDYGCKWLTLSIHNGDANPIESINVVSGIPTNQNFEKGSPNNQPGCCQPLPQGDYSVQNRIDWAGGKGNYDASFGPGLGPVWVPIEPLFNTQRGNFGFHLDYGRINSPGSAGCIVFTTVADLKRFVCWFDDPDTAPTSLKVDWGL